MIALGDWQDTLRRQFGAAIEMLENAIAAHAPGWVKRTASGLSEARRR